MLRTAEATNRQSAALNAVVMVLLAAGLFMMVRPKEPAAVSRLSVGEDGGEERKAVRPRPDDPPDPKPENVDKTGDETRNKARDKAW